MTVKKTKLTKHVYKINFTKATSILVGRLAAIVSLIQYPKTIADISTDIVTKMCRYLSPVRKKRKSPHRTVLCRHPIQYRRVRACLI